MSFSAEWLSLREPVDHASRAADLAMDVAAFFADHDHVSVVDLGCGTGSNLRATAMLLPARQDWLLVDYDPALLLAARETLATWADSSAADGEALALTKAGRTITVCFRQADLAAGAGGVLAGRPHLVTAAALFDLISQDWINRFAQDVAAVGAAFYTVLTYNGVDAFRPSHRADADIVAAFAAHQQGDKGFGRAAGPLAPDALREGFRAAGYAVAEGDSPWRLGASQKALAQQLLPGMANAVAETGKVAPDVLKDWLTFRINAAETAAGAVITGHTDTFATPC